MEQSLTGAIVFLTREGEAPSLMLEDILFDPAALWLAKSLQRAGVSRFLVACHREDREAAEGCFPAGTAFVTTGSENAREELHTFLDNVSGQVAVFTRPVFLDETGGGLPQGDPAGAYLVDAGDLRDVEGDLPGKVRAAGKPFGGGVMALAPANWEAVQAAARRSSVERLRREGVRFIDPAAAYIGPRVTVGRGTAILPGTILRGETHIGQNCEIGPNAMLRDTVVGDDTTVNASQTNECTIGSHTTVGPFAYIRPNTQVGDHVRVGDFVELKNSGIGDGTKISHLTYVGDSDVGCRINFGCGTVTVNYDGDKKFRTRIGDDVFIGCNTNLVAPVSVGRGAYIAAGSTITRDVPADSLAIARSQQTVKNQWAKKRRAKSEK